MRIAFSKILFALAVGLLLGHQLIAHHHHDDFDIAASIHGNNHDDAHDHLPPHHVAHIFSIDNVKSSVAKETACAFYLPAIIDFIFSFEEPLTVKREYVEIRPPLIKGYQYFSLRAPPAA